MRKREANFSVRFRSWIRAHPPKLTSHFEVKQTTTDSIPFKCVEEQQIEYGEAIQTGAKGVLMRNLGGNGEPDYTYLYGDPVFIVIKYPDFFCIIPLGVFTIEKRMSKRKSLTAERAKKISPIVVELRKR